MEQVKSLSKNQLVCNLCKAAKPTVLIEATSEHCCTQCLAFFYPTLYVQWYQERGFQND